jgi:hypothetical protein
MNEILVIPFDSKVVCGIEDEDVILAPTLEISTLASKWRGPHQAVRHQIKNIDQELGSIRNVGSIFPLTRFFVRSDYSFKGKIPEARRTTEATHLSTCFRHLLR